MDSSRQFEFDRRRHHDSGSGPVEAAKHDDDDDDVDGNVNVNDNPPPGHQIRCWGRSFTWTVHHFTPTHLHPLKYTYDKLADDCLAQLHPLQSSTTDKQHPTDLYALLKSTHHTPTSPNSGTRHTPPHHGSPGTKSNALRMFSTATPSPSHAH
ncbi:hypothetical protein AAP_02058 [Ascosphaera apis ARSEF 7405]|uniref:Uncharacterized protein n=1 Tax=Ascosphaera apis ARSEF 7405 TaxID=392613 RepID=A0A168AII8_9EURO|nr:hypothetical protein AAP_02058 [Ascosphaera apis ARSEF 7405]